MKNNVNNGITVKFKYFWIDQNHCDSLFLLMLYELVLGLSIAMNWEDVELTGASRLDV